MKKHNIFIRWITIGTLFSIFSAFSNNENKVDKNTYPWSIGKENKFVFNSRDGLTLTLKKRTLTPAGATFIYKNEGTDIVYFGTKYFLQIYLDEKWFNMVSSTFWTLELIRLNPGEEAELPIDWSNFYGDLPPGNYRFIKEFHVSEPLGELRYVNYPFMINGNQRKYH